MAAGLGHEHAPAVQEALTTYAYAGGGTALTSFPAVLRARGVGAWRERRGADTGCAGTTRREGMRTEAKVKPTLPESSQPEVSAAWPLSLTIDPATTTVSVPARTVRAPSLGIVWH
jgi:hypothetical protein